MKSPAMQLGFRLFFYLAGGVSMKLRATDGSSVALFHFTLEFKDKSKIRGSRPPTAPYSFAGPKE